MCMGSPWVCSATAVRLVGMMWSARNQESGQGGLLPVAGGEQRWSCSPQANLLPQTLSPGQSQRSPRKPSLRSQTLWVFWVFPSAGQTNPTIGMIYGPGTQVEL